MLKMTIEGIHVKLDAELEKYATKKVSALEKYIPRKARASARAEVILRRQPSKDKNDLACEITVHLPHGILNSQEKTQHLYAAIDIATAKARGQLQKYKAEFDTPKLYRRLFNRHGRPA
ncbi:MAG: ribosome-associated translation inhibitor RaiA [Candidatus Saccharimonadales bacterium]